MAKSKPFTRQGLHRLECDCGAYVYATVAALEAHGLPVCACGETFQPGRVELAELLNVDCPAVAEYRDALSSVLHGQAFASGNGRRGNLRPAESVALERVERHRRELARARRVGAILPKAQPIPF